MNFQFLPNYFKKIGLFIFIAAGIPSMKRGFLDGWNAAKGIPTPESYHAFTIFGQTITEPIYNLFAIVGVIGLLFYVFAKDKAMDEFIMRLRLEAVHLTFIISALFIFSVLIFEVRWTVSAMGVIEYQVILFLIINKIKKLSVLPGEGTGYE
jgi:hypothetical protein